MNAFERSDGVYAGLVGFLRGAEAALLSHAELEARLAVEGRELQRQLLQDHLDLRALREVALPGVCGRDGAVRPSVEAGHERGLATIFGLVGVSRLAYRARGCPNLHPADAALNLPQERHSHGLRQLAALEAARGSYAEAVQAIARATGVAVGKRQCEQLVARTAACGCAFRLLTGGDLFLEKLDDVQSRNPEPLSEEEAAEVVYRP